MTLSIGVEAVKGQESHINALFARAFPGSDPLIWDEPRIECEIATTKGDERLKHLHWISTIEEWNDAFPAMAFGRGQIEAGDWSSDFEIEIARRQSTWVVQNRLLFERIDGLQAPAGTGSDATTTVVGYARGRPIYPKLDRFEDADAEPENPVYALVKLWNRPDIWKRYLAFRASQGLDSWEELRNAVVPSGTRSWTIWQRVELMHFEMTGQRSGLSGRFNGRAPSMALVEAALGVSAPVMDEIQMRQSAA